MRFIKEKHAIWIFLILIYYYIAILSGYSLSLSLLTRNRAKERNSVHQLSRVDCARMGTRPEAARVEYEQGRYHASRFLLLFGVPHERYEDNKRSIVEQL